MSLEKGMLLGNWLKITDRRDRPRRSTSEGSEAPISPMESSSLFSLVLPDYRDSKDEEP